MMLGAARVLAQATTPNPPANCSSTQATEAKPCPAPATPSQQFPYPGEKDDPAAAPATPAPQTSSPTASSTPSTDAPPPANAPSPSPAKQFPYPGEDPESTSSTSSSSSSSSSNAGNPDAAAPSDASKSPLKDAGSDGQFTRRKLPKVERLQTDDDRESEDLEIAKYYLSAGNPMASYLRAKDAIKIKPTDPDAHFSLAQAAEKLKKHDEAVSEFKAYLQLEPDGLHVKSAQRSLAELH